MTLGLPWYNISNSNFGHLVLFFVLLKIYISTYFHLKTYKINHNNLIKLILTLKIILKKVQIPNKKNEFWSTFDENLKPLSWNSIFEDEPINTMISFLCGYNRVEHIFLSLFFYYILITLTLIVQYSILKRDKNQAYDQNINYMN